MKELKPVRKLEDAMVVRHNYLIEARYKASVQEQRLFLWLVHEIQDDNEVNRKFKVSIRDIADFIGLDKGRHLYNDMAGVTNRASRRHIEIRDLERGELIQSTLLSARYMPGGILEIEVSSFLLPYIRELKKNFTTIELKYAMRLSSGYAMRIYDLIKSASYRTNELELPIDDLQAMLGVSENYKGRFNNFRCKVLEVAMRDINERTNFSLKCSYKRIKTRVTHVVFNFKQRRVVENPYLPETADDQLFRRLVSHGLRESEARKAITDYGASDRDRIIWTLDELDRRIQGGSIKKPVAWLRHGLWKDDMRPQLSLFDRQGAQERTTKINRKDATHHKSPELESTEKMERIADRKYADYCKSFITECINACSKADLNEWKSDVASKIKFEVSRRTWEEGEHWTNRVFSRQVFEVIADHTGRAPMTKKEFLKS